MSDSVVVICLAQRRQLAQHSMPTVVSVVAGVSCCSVSVKKLVLSPLMLSVWVPKTDDECDDISGCVLICVRVCLRYFLSWGRGWYVVLITNHNITQLSFVGNCLCCNWASTATDCTAVASLLFHEQTWKCAVSFEDDFSSCLDFLGHNPWRDCRSQCGRAFSHDLPVPVPQGQAEAWRTSTTQTEPQEGPCLWARYAATHTSEIRFLQENKCGCTELSNWMSADDLREYSHGHKTCELV